ncbi:potassium channel family protein [Tuberibacillus sp. Marseille-P3662]|uniref:potassium channel family protein n=1 Tax=Tuberibacillus sp. Marseille-P3662 TaxID=1965358 RepID=UPI0026E3F564|nr:TrkA family potassium uptake protein [Tuberibacillus sp. Marseille-P3662]
MNVKKQYAVIGLGRFGGSICWTLSEQGQEVLAIDMDEDRVNEYTPIATHAVIADSTDETVLKSLGLRNFDHVIVAIGDNIQASTLTTLILKELGVEKVTAKAQNDYHEKVLRKIGADQVSHPERDMGTRIANNITSSSVLDYLELSDQHSIMEVIAGQKMDGQTLIDLDVRAKFGVNIVAIKEEGNINVSPRADQTVNDGDILIIIGADNDIDRFKNHMLDN